MSDSKGTTVVTGGVGAIYAAGLAERGTTSSWSAVNSRPSTPLPLPWPKKPRSR